MVRSIFAPLALFLSVAICSGCIIDKPKPKPAACPECECDCKLLADKPVPDASTGSTSAPAESTGPLPDLPAPIPSESTGR